MRIYVSIPYSSGLSFRNCNDDPLDGGAACVSIPYSSGLSFRIFMNLDTHGPLKKESQSLIHQVSVSEELVTVVKQKDYLSSQSLIHQVSVSEINSKLCILISI